MTSRPNTPQSAEEPEPEPASGAGELASVGRPRLRGRGPWVRFAALGLLWAGAAVVVTTSGVGEVDALREQVAGAGPLAPAEFAAVFAAVTLAPVPKNALSAGAGLLFGFGTGLVAVWAGAMLGAVTAFWLARALGRDAVTRLTGARMARADALLRRRGLLGVLGARLVPVVPFTLVNYASGLGPVRFTHYLSGTALGIIPGTVAYVALGAYGTSPSSWQFVVAVAALAALTLGGIVWARRTHRAKSRPAAAGPGTTPSGETAAADPSPIPHGAR